MTRLANFTKFHLSPDMSMVHAKFPKTGLGNMLLIWARAKIFAHINDLPMITAPWWGLRPGAWVRNEKRKRVYWGYFKEDSFLKRLRAFFYKQKAVIVKDPAIDLVKEDLKKNSYYLFNKVVTDNDLFGSLREHRNFIRQELVALLSNACLREFEKYKYPVIAVHIRRGDFKLGNAITPLSFFIDGINAIRDFVGKEWPVTIFTDAETGELTEILALPGVSIAGPKADILDILLMSKSKALILSQSSTFSYWGAFLSDAVVIKPENDWQGELRSKEINNIFPEIRWREGNDECRESLKSHLKKIQIGNPDYFNVSL